MYPSYGDAVTAVVLRWRYGPVHGIATPAITSAPVPLRRHRRAPSRWNARSRLPRGSRVGRRSIPRSPSATPAGWRWTWPPSARRGSACAAETSVRRRSPEDGRVRQRSRGRLTSSPCAPPASTPRSMLSRSNVASRVAPLATSTGLVSLVGARNQGWQRRDQGRPGEMEYRAAGPNELRRLLERRAIRRPGGEGGQSSDRCGDSETTQLSRESHGSLRCASAVRVLRRVERTAMALARGTRVARRVL